MKKIICLLLTLCLVITTSAYPKTEVTERIEYWKIRITSEPTGASVYLNGVDKGTTPLDLELEVEVKDIRRSSVKFSSLLGNLTLQLTLLPLALIAYLGGFRPLENVEHETKPLRQKCKGLDYKITVFKGPFEETKYVNSQTCAPVVNFDLTKKLPPALATSVEFDDWASFLPNKALDGGEEDKIMVAVKNEGEGRALDVVLTFASDNPKVVICPSKSLGEILPGKTETIEVPIKAAYDAPDGKAAILVKAGEKRGYEAKPVKLLLDVRHLEKPVLEITSTELNDANIGRAKGNGNGIPENGETIELIACVKNKGSGKSINTNLELVSINQGIETIESSASLGEIQPGKIAKGKVIFHIPRAFFDNSLNYKLRASEVRGVGTDEKSQVVALRRHIPLLTYQLNYPEIIHNGDDIRISVIPENRGSLTAEKVKLELTSTSNIEITDKTRTIGIIKPAEKVSAESFKIKIPRAYSKNFFPLDVSLSQNDFPEKTGRETIPVKLIFPTPHLVDRYQDANSDGKITQGEKFDLSITVSNAGELEARDVTLSVSCREPWFELERKEFIGTIPAGTACDPLVFTFSVPREVASGALPIKVKLTQSDYPSVIKTLNYEVYEEKAELVAVKGEEEYAPVISLAVKGNEPPMILSDTSETEYTHSSTFHLRPAVSDDRGISYVQVKLNDSLVYDSRRDPEAGEKLEKSKGKLLNFETGLTGIKTGKNQLLICAMDTDNLMSEKEITLIYTPVEIVSRLDNPSDVDVDIPRTNMKNPDAVAVILGIKDYRYAPQATFADRDAKTFYEYAKSVFGIPKENIYFRINEEATKGEFDKIFEENGWIARRITKNRSDIIIYFSGHGAPDIKSKRPYLIPYDVDPNYAAAAYSVEDVYRNLSKSGAKSITIFLDACFSGRSREKETLLADARPLMVKPGSPETYGNITVFTASTGEEISSSYREMKHGLFTYFLLKGLQGDADRNKDKRINVEELFQYLRENIRREAGSMDREQTPQLLGGKKEKVVIKLK